MGTERPWSTRTPHFLSAIFVAACSIYDPTLLTSGLSSASGGELGAETGGLPGKTESTGGASSLGGARTASGGSNRGGSTGAAEGGATGGNAAAGTSTYGAGGDSGGTPASGGSLSQGGSGMSGGNGGSATATGGTATGGVASTQGGSSSSGGSGGKSSSGGSGGKSSGGAAGGSSCAGKLFQGLCWYLGPRGASCDATCAAYGGVAPGAQAFVGTTAQGGSVTECGQLLVLLGVTTAPFLGTRDDVGLGCHLYDADPYWLDAPDFTTDASVPEARLVCACR